MFHEQLLLQKLRFTHKEKLLISVTLLLYFNSCENVTFVAPLVKYNLILHYDQQLFSASVTKLYNTG